MVEIIKASEIFDNADSIKSKMIEYINGKLRNQITIFNLKDIPFYESESILNEVLDEYRNSGEFYVSITYNYYASSKLVKFIILDKSIDEIKSDMINFINNELITNKLYDQNNVIIIKKSDVPYSDCIDFLKEVLEMYRDKSYYVEITTANDNVKFIEFSMKQDSTPNSKFTSSSDPFISFKESVNW